MVKSRKNIVLFTIEYPFGVMEHSFLKEELRYLKDNFEKVIIVPQKTEGTRMDLPEGVIVNTSLASMIKEIPLINKLGLLFNKVLLKELIATRFNRNKMRYAITCQLAAQRTFNWLKQNEVELNLNNAILYSFWFDFTTYASTIYKKSKSNITVVSRCHNFDIYGTEWNEYYVPFQKYVVRQLDAIYPDSKEGELYLKKKYHLNNCEADLMAVPPATRQNQASTDDVLRIFSCANMIPRKRILLIMQALIELSRLAPNINLNWTHVGDGPEWDSIMKLRANLPVQIKTYFPGRMSNEDLQQYYIDNPIDLYLNVSIKEGTPVAVIEAISHGIPVLATEFGGAKEIAEDGAGFLISVDANERELAKKIIEFAAMDKAALRDNAYRIWDMRYNSQKNYPQFCEKINSIRS